MKNRSPPLTEFHDPGTFRSRGVAAAFTTPALAGTRIRASKRSDVELVVPNPAGSQGVYIVHWPGVRALCNPTVHDTILFRRLSAAPRVDPRSVRETGLAVALEGYAGRDAATAAEIVIDRDRSHLRSANRFLLTALIGQVEPGDKTAGWSHEPSPELERQARHVLRRLAGSLDQPATHLASALAAMGQAYAPVCGGAQGPRSARIPRLISRIQHCHADLSHWLDADSENDISGLGAVVKTLAKVAQTGAEALLAEIHAALADPVTLLKRWIADPVRAFDQACRVDWLLDGWEPVCLLWSAAASSTARRKAMLEIAQQLPVMPRETATWINVAGLQEAMVPNRRVISHNDAWRTGSAAFTLIHRNETIRALSE